MDKWIGGWVDDPDAVEAVAALQPFDSFGSTVAGADQASIPDHIYLWDAARKVTGGLLPPRNQGQIGSCVSFGTSAAIEYTMLTEIVQGDLEEYKPLAEEVIYAGARVEVGGGKLRGDGAYGAYAAQFAKDWGVIYRGVFGKHDLTKYDVDRCRAWGKSGVPSDIEILAKAHPIQTITRVKTWAEAKRALANGFGIAVCAKQGFKMERDADGFCAPGSPWNHCTCLDGYQTGSREGGHLRNSWGANSHSGPVGAGSPGTEGFWVDAKVLEGMLASGDCWAFSAFQGFLVSKIDWANL